MSAFSDLIHGNFGNIGHDLAADPIGTAIGGTALAIGSAGLLAPEIFGAEAGGGLFAGLFGGGEEAAAAGAGGSALLGAGDSAALGFGADTALGGEGLGAIDAALGFGPAPNAVDAAVGQFPASFGAADLPAGATSTLGSTSGLPGIDVGAGALSGAGGGAGGAAGGAAASSPGFLSQLGSGALSSITRNPLGIAAAGVGLGANLLRGNPTDPNQQALQQQAQQLGAQGQALQQYLANGTLPPAMKASLDQATAAAKARIVANHAKNGMSTDPTQNSALAQELSAVDTNAVSAMATAQIEMMKTGLNATGLSSQLYEMLTRMDRQNNQDTMTAIQNFAAALGGGSRAQPLARAA